MNRLKQSSGHSAITKIQRITVIAGIIILVGKFAAYILTNSNAILTDALESIVNVVAGSFTLYSLIISARPRDKNHPYGHGKIEFIAAVIEGTMIVIAGMLIIGKSVYNLFIPTVIHKLDIGLAIIIATGIFNFILGYILTYNGKKNQSLPLIASGKHLLSDAYSTVGLIIGLVLILLTNFLWLDSVVAIIFGIIILVTGIRIVRPSISGIMDEADNTEIGNLIKLINEHRKPEWIDTHNMRLIKYGRVFHIDCHLTLPWYFSIKQGHDEVKEIEDIVNTNSGNEVEFFIHSDYCTKLSCNLCQMDTCEVRQTPFKKKLEWTLENVMDNQQHFIKE
jgi:cation diffusion facilitator family transporter